MWYKERKTVFFSFFNGDPPHHSISKHSVTVPKNANRSSSRVPHLCYNSVAYSQKTDLCFLLFIKDRTMTANIWHFRLNNYVGFLLIFYLILPAPAPAGAYFSAPGVSNNSGHHFSLLPPIISTERTEVQKSSMESANNVLIDVSCFLEHSNNSSLGSREKM